MSNMSATTIDPVELTQALIRCASVTPTDAGALGVMFPRGRYIVLRDVEQLPALLSRAYLRLTRA